MPKGEDPGIVVDAAWTNPAVPTILDLEDPGNAGDGANGKVGREAVSRSQIVVAVSVNTNVRRVVDLAAYPDRVVASIGESPHRSVDGLALLLPEDQLAFDRDRLHGRATFLWEVCSPILVKPTRHEHAQRTWFLTPK